MTLRSAAALLLLATLMGTAARADGCDALTVRMIRATGASLAGRVGALVVFRATDAERMSLSCGKRSAMLFRADSREPQRAYFILIGQAGRALAGAREEVVETLALNLHQATLLTGLPQSGRAGPLAIRCEAGDRPDGFHQAALCRIAPAEPLRHLGLSGGRQPG